MEIIKNLLINDENIKSIQVKEATDFNVKKLLNNNNLDQSQSIRFGKLFEKLLKDLIKGKGYKIINEEFLDVYNTGSKTNKGKKDLDICFIKDDTIFYFESKLNLNLDSEKSKATDDKILEINDYLINENKNLKVVSSLITCWWEKEEGMVITTKTNILFMKDFLGLIGISCTKSEYYKIMFDFGKLI